MTASSATRLPRRRDDLFLAPLGDGLVLYDPQALQTHTLNATAAAIWTRCDGAVSVPVLIASLAAAFEVPEHTIDDAVERSLGELADSGLLAGTVPDRVPSTPRAVDAADLPDPADIRFPHATRTFAAGRLRLRYETTDADLRDYLDQVLEPLAVDEPHRHRFRVLLGDRGARGAAWFDDELVVRLGSLSGAGAVLLWSLNRAAVDRAEGVVTIHAAAIARGSRVVVLPAPPNGGKSTLTAALVRAGCHYLGDEAIAIDLRTGELVVYAKPIALDPGSWPLFPDLAPDLPPELAVFEHRKWYLDPATVGPDPQAPAGLHDIDIAGVVIPAYVAGSPCTVEPLDHPETARVLAENAFDLPAAGEQGLLRLVGIASRASAVRLVSGDLQGSVDAVLALLDESG